MIGDKRKTKRRGFSLVEMVVAVGIFSIVSVVIAQLFTTFTRTQQRAGINQKIQSDARVMMAQISDRIRSAEINYDAYGSQIPVPTDDLWIIDENGLEVVIRRSDIDFANTTCPSAASTPCLEISEDGGVTFSPMTTENYTVDSAQFFISPETDPSSGGLDIQPRVTFSLGIRNASPDAVLQAPTYVQSTVSARVYPGSAGITIPAAPVTSICGNGVIEGSEQCDDGNTTDGDGCSAVCQNELIPVCGNGALEGTEQCDDGNTSNNDGCSATCFIEIIECGNGIVEAGEACDDGNTTDAGTCNATCTDFTFCGDGVVQNPNGNSQNETCDDGNVANLDGCSSACIRECGNGQLEPAEQCDPGMSNPYGCTNSCSVFSGIAGVHSVASNGRLVVMERAHFNADLSMREMDFNGNTYPSSYHYPGTQGYGVCDFGAIAPNNDFYCVAEVSQLMPRKILRFSPNQTQGVQTGTIKNTDWNQTTWPHIAKFYGSTLWYRHGYGLTGISTNGSIVRKIGRTDSSGRYIAGTSAGQFDLLMDFGIDSSGNIYAPDSRNHRVQVFSSSGSFTRMFGSQGSGNGQFLSPNSADADNSYIYVVDTGNGRVQKFTKTGSYVSQWATPGDPYNVDVDNSSGYIHVTVREGNHTKLLRYSNTGILIDSIP